MPDAHRDADVRRLQGRRVVHAVARHRHDVAGLLEEPDEADLVLRRDPGDHADLRQLALQLLVGHRGELLPGDGPARDPQLACDRGSRRRMIAGDHPHPDARFGALGDGGLRLRSRRIDDPNHREQGEVLHEGDQVPGGIERRRVELPLGHHHHSMPRPGHAVVRFEGR